MSLYAISALTKEKLWCTLCENGIITLENTLEIYLKGKYTYNLGTNSTSKYFKYIDMRIL